MSESREPSQTILVGVSGKILVLREDDLLRWRGPTRVDVKGGPEQYEINKYFVVFYFKKKKKAKRGKDKGGS